MMIIGVVLIGVLIYFITKKSRLSGSQETTPLELLQKRFVNGEINQEEYKAMREVLRK